MLDRLPAEILSWIIQFINDKSDLTSLSLVSRLLYQHAIPKLYRSITIWAKHKRNLSNLDLRILAHSTKHLQYVKNLQFKTPFQGRFRVHCPRSDYDSDKDFANEYISSSDEDSLSQIQSDDEFEYGLVSEETNQNADYDPSVHTINDEAEATATGKVESGEILKSGTSDTDGQSQVSMSQMFANGKHETFLRDLTSRLLPLFQNINESNLQSFSWDLGTCVPPYIPDYLSSKQAQLTTLTITGDTTCFCLNDRDLGIHRLNGLSQLRRISWRVPRAVLLRTLGALLLQNAARLQEIKIDCGWPSSETWLRKCLNIEAGTRLELFGALRRLTLFGISLENGVEDIISAFRIHRLQYLKLQDCFGTNEMLDCLAKSSRSACLTSFELDFAGTFDDQTDIAPLMRFLRSFQGLEDLFVLYPPQWTLGREYWNSISEHHSSLRRVVHQDSGAFPTVQGDEIDGLFEFLCGLEMTQCLGICSQPSSLSNLLARIDPRPSLTLLHIRPRGWMNLETDGEDRNFRFESDFSEHLPLVKGFANWAFGPNGLPDLRILAYGDFTFGGGHPNILLRRSSNEADFSSSNVMFRELGKADGGLWELVQENADFLEACPEDYLVHQW